MKAFIHHFAFEFRAGIRNKQLLLLNYLFPLGFYLMMGLIMAEINPPFRENIIPAMVVFGVLSAALLGIPDPLVNAREMGIFRSFKINGVPASSILIIPALTTALHLVVVTLLITLTAPWLFRAPLPAYGFSAILIWLALVFACTGISVLIGVISPSSRMTVLWSQLVFSPSMLLGGLMLPYNLLPAAAGKIAQLLPATQAMNAYTGLATQKTADFSPWGSLVILVIGGALAFGLAAYLFQWDSRNTRRRASPLLALLVLLPNVVGMVWFTPIQAEAPVSPTAANLPNPASGFCEQRGGKLALRQDAAGGVAGVCVFGDGSECDEWAFFRGECAPGSIRPTPGPAVTPAAPPAGAAGGAELASDGCRIYRNPGLGYSFHYPANAQIIANDDPLRSISIIGPVVAGESWPQITLSHPADRAEYRPPGSANLLQWLTDHQFLGEPRQPDVTIAGLPAIQLRHNRSPQSYAYNRYFFAKSGQLYNLVIGHSGDREDWNLYNHFLQSIQFER